MAAWKQATAGQRHQLLNKIRERRGWSGSLRQAQSRVAHWLDPEHQTTLPAYVLELAIEVWGHADFLEPLHAAELRALRQNRTRMRKVEPGRRGRAAG